MKNLFVRFGTMVAGLAFAFTFITTYQQCAFIFNQPKEPEAVRNLRKKNNVR